LKTLIIYIISWFSLLGASIFIFRKVVRPDYLKRGRLTWGSATLQALIFFVYGGLPIIYLRSDWPTLPGNMIQSVSGLIGIGLGLSGLFIGMAWLGIQRSFGRGESGLRKSGIYRITRNPQALACGVYVIGFVALWPSWYAVGWAFLYVILIHEMILREEEHLHNLYGEEYERFCAEVPRYLRFGE
jgi:protein-S-isoprenylcysteine O-methyltransferase Ste14